MTKLTHLCRSFTLGGVRHASQLAGPPPSAVQNAPALTLAEARSWIISCSGNC